MITSLLDGANTGMVVVDAQEKLMRVMGRRDAVVQNIVKLLRLSKLFDLPVIVTEQFTKMLGPTVGEIKSELKTYDPVSKRDFNCCDVEEFNRRIESGKLKKIILTGVESHVCVYQTCFSLVKKGYELHVPRDAVDSRKGDDLAAGLELMRDCGATVTSTEAVVFQLLKKAGTREFKEMLKIVR